MKMNKTEKLKEALFNRFNKYGVTHEQINESVHEGDPFGWSSNAAFTITTESGLPSASYDAFEDWLDINEELSRLGLFAECVNAAVVAVYED